MPAHLGLFASALPSMLAALFVSSKYLQTGPVALTALLTFGALSGLAEPASSEYIALAALLALLVGMLRVFLGLARLGAVAYLLSEPVLLGFTTGAAVLIVSSQLPKVFDLEPAGRGVLLDAASALIDVGSWSWVAIVFSVGALVAMFGGRRLHKLFPGVLLAVVVGTVISATTGYDGAVVGQLDGGFLSLGFDFDWSLTGSLVLPALAIALVGFAEPSSIARTFAADEGLRWDANREMVSQGVANLAAAVSGAFPVGGSFSRSSLNRMAGATSPWAGALTGLCVLAALPLTPLLEDLPRAILGAVVIGAVVKLIRLREIIELVPRAPAQGAVAVGTLAATLASAPRVERGVLAGVVLALLAHVGQQLVVDVAAARDGAKLTVGLSGTLWFASVAGLEASVRRHLEANDPLESVSFDLTEVSWLDYTAGAAVGRIVRELLAKGIEVTVVGVGPGATASVAIHVDPRAFLRAGSEPAPEGASRAGSEGTAGGEPSPTREPGR